MESYSVLLIGAALGVGALVMKIYPPPSTYRPVAYTFVILLFVLGVLLHPYVMTALAKLPGAPLVVFLVTGAICTVAYVMTGHPPAPPQLNTTSPATPPSAPTPEPSPSQTPAPPKNPPPERPVAKKRENSPTQSSSGNNSPNVVQGPGSIAQFGNNNQAAIVNREERTISDSQMVQLVERLRPFAGPKVMIRLNQATNESTQFGMRIAQLLKSAGIEVVEITPVMSFGAAGYIPHIAFVVDGKQNAQERLAPAFLILDVFPVG